MINIQKIVELDIAQHGFELSVHESGVTPGNFVASLITDIHDEHDMYSEIYGDDEPTVAGAIASLTSALKLLTPEWGVHE